MSTDRYFHLPTLASLRSNIYHRNLPINTLPFLDLSSIRKRKGNWSIIGFPSNYYSNIHFYRIHCMVRRQKSTSLAENWCFLDILWDNSLRSRQSYEPIRRCSFLHRRRGIQKWKAVVGTVGRVVAPRIWCVGCTLRLTPFRFPNFVGWELWRHTGLPLGGGSVVVDEWAAWKWIVNARETKRNRAVIGRFSCGFAWQVPRWRY